MSVRSGLTPFTPGSGDNTPGSTAEASKIEGVVAMLNEHVRYEYMPAKCREAMEQAAALIGRLEAERDRAQFLVQVADAARMGTVQACGALRRSLEEHGEALKPFARAADEADEEVSAPFPDYVPLGHVDDDEVTLGDCRRARSVLAGRPAERDAPAEAALPEASVKAEGRNDQQGAS